MNVFILSFSSTISLLHLCSSYCYYWYHSPSPANLDATFCLHQLQFGLCQLQLQRPQLFLQSVLLLVQRLGGCLVPAGGRCLEGPQGAEKVPAVLTAHYLTLQGHTRGQWVNILYIDMWVQVKAHIWNPDSDLVIKTADRYCMHGDWGWSLLSGPHKQPH